MINPVHELLSGARCTATLFKFTHVPVWERLSYDARLCQPLYQPKPRPPSAQTIRSFSWGPKLIEHDAPTFSGNSGSPIINKENWEVIGVDTFSRKRDLLEWFNQYSKEQNESQIKNEVRLFGYRLDNIPKWEKILFTKLYRQNNDIIEIQTETLSVFSAIMGSDWHYQRSDTVSRIRNRFYKRMVGNIAFQDQVRYKQLARSALYTHLNSMQKRAEANIQNAYAIMRQDYFKTIALCKAVKEFVGRYYESDSSVDPFETRNQI